MATFGTTHSMQPIRCVRYSITTTIRVHDNVFFCFIRLSHYYDLLYKYFLFIEHKERYKVKAKEEDFYKISRLWWELNKTRVGFRKLISYFWYLSGWVLEFRKYYPKTVLSMYNRWENVWPRLTASLRAITLVRVGVLR